MTGLDPRALVGPAMLIIGALPLVLAYRFAAEHPINRVLSLGPFVTGRGLVFLLSLRLFFFALGLFLVTWGLANIVFWFLPVRDVYHPLVRFLGTLGTGLALWTAGQALWIGFRMVGKW